MKDMKKVTVFISSPADVALDRKLVETTLQKFSEEKENNYHFIAFDFEKVASEFCNKNAQGTIDAQLPNYDIYIGLMGERFGTPTDKFGSGTEHEFEEALLRLSKGKATHVGFLFKKSLTPLHKLKADQLAQYTNVLSFQEKISPLGVFQTYEGEDDLNEQVKQILNRFIKKVEDSESEQAYQAEMLTEVASRDVFKVNQKFVSDILMSLGADLTNGYKTTMHLDDVYVSLDANLVNKYTEDAQDNIDSEVINLSELETLEGRSSTRFFILGDESTGKTSFCKRSFKNFHRDGLVPVYISGRNIKNASADRLSKLVEAAFVEQYSEAALPRYRLLKPNEKVIIIDDIDESSLNNKHKFIAINIFEEFASHIICTADQVFLFNATLSSVDDVSKISHFKNYKLRDIGHALTDELIRKWLSAGREDTISDDELYASTETCRNIVDGIFGANFVPRRPLMVLILLQAIQGGTASDFSQSSFVRYYKYLIDTTLLGRVSKAKVDIYYAFLPEVAFAIYSAGTKNITNSEMDTLINDFCERRGLQNSDLIAAKSNLFTLGVTELNEGRISFRHPFVYYYFLSQYLSDNLENENIAKLVIDICEKLFLRENANVIVFLSYHTKSTLIIETVMKVANSIFSDVENFSLEDNGVELINNLIAESPKIVISNEAKVERQKLLKRRDELERRASNDDSDAQDAMDFSAQLSTGFRSMEIIGQLLKNHYAKFDAKPKRELYTAAANVTFRCLNVLMIALSNDLDALADLAKQSNKRIESDKEAKKAVFSLAHMFVFNFIKSTSKYTGADTLSKTYEEVLAQNDSLNYKILDLSVKLDSCESFPIESLREVVSACGENKLALTTVRNLVKYRLYMKPIEEYKQRQQICDAVGISLKNQLLIEKKSASAA